MSRSKKIWGYRKFRMLKVSLCVFAIAILWMGYLQKAKAIDYLSDGNWNFSIKNGKAVDLHPKVKDLLDGEVMIPESVMYNGISYIVETLQNAGFVGCKFMTKVTIPASVVGFVKYSNLEPTSNFTWCPMLQYIDVEQGNLNFKQIDGVLYSKDGKLLHAYPQAKMGITYQIPDGVTKLMAYVFASNPYLESVTMPDSVVECEKACFMRARKLKSVILSKNLTSLYIQMFCQCNNLESIEIPTGVKDIGHECFVECFNLKKVTLPESVEMIFSAAFQTKEIEEITILNSSMTFGNILLQVDIYPIYPTTTIKGHAGSTAEIYATKAKAPFIPFYVRATEAVTLAQNASSQLTLTANVAVTPVWSSVDSTIATVDQNGLVTGKNGGTTTVNVSCIIGDQEYKTSSQVTVTSSTGSGITTPIPQETPIPPSVTTKQTYTSSNPKVAKVNSSGKITKVSAGKTVITIKNKNGKIVKKYTYTVAGIAVNKKNLTVKGVGKKYTLKAKTYKLKLKPYKNGKKLIFTTTNKKVATVSSKGVVKATGAGTCSIRIKCRTKTKTYTVVCKVNVKKK